MVQTLQIQVVIKQNWLTGINAHNNVSRQLLNGVVQVRVKPAFKIHKDSIMIKPVVMQCVHHQPPNGLVRVGVALLVFLTLMDSTVMKQPVIQDAVVPKICSGAPVPISAAIRQIVKVVLGMRVSTSVFLQKIYHVPKEWRVNLEPVDRSVMVLGVQFPVRQGSTQHVQHPENVVMEAIVKLFNVEIMIADFVMVVLVNVNCGIHFVLLDINVSVTAANNIQIHRVIAVN